MKVDADSGAVLSGSTDDGEDNQLARMHRQVDRAAAAESSDSRGAAAEVGASPTGGRFATQEAQLKASFQDHWGDVENFGERSHIGIPGIGGIGGMTAEVRAALDECVKNGKAPPARSPLGSQFTRWLQVRRGEREQPTTTPEVPRKPLPARTTVYPKPLPYRNGSDCPSPRGFLM